MKLNIREKAVADTPFSDVILLSLLSVQTGEFSISPLPSFRQHDPYRFQECLDVSDIANFFQLSPKKSP